LAFGELILVDKGCPKLNLQIRADNKEVIYFYKAVGYDEDKVISFDRFNSRLISAKDYYDLDFSLLRDDPYSLLRESTK
jgi:hypothetical protein